MKFMATIYEDEQGYATASEAGLARVIDAYNAFGEEAGAAGVLIGGHALQPTPTGRTIRVRDGERLVTDGPFAETKEQLGGYYLLECKDLDEAVEWAAKIPGARSGSVEVRPIMEFEGTTTPQAEQQAGTQA